MNEQIHKQYVQTKHTHKQEERATAFIMRRRRCSSRCSSSMATALVVVIATALAAVTPSLPQAWAFVGAPPVVKGCSSRSPQQREKSIRASSALSPRRSSKLAVTRCSKCSTLVARLGVTRERISYSKVRSSGGDGVSDTSIEQQEGGEAEKDPFVRLTLDKPLGVQFEEIRAGFPGLMVSDVLEGGSAIENGKIGRNMLLVSLDGRDVTGATFDFVMEKMMAIPSGTSIDLVFRDPSVPVPTPPPPPPPPPAKTCEITVYGPDGKPVVVTAKDGDNLRRVLLDAKINVYDIMGKLSNCNGAGQCGTCVVDVEKSDGWDERPNWEGDKLKGRPESHRLSCQSIIKGDAVIATLPPKGR